MKIVKDRIHMNTQGGRRLRQAIAIRGKIEIGSQPIHEDSLASSADSISPDSLGDDEVILLLKS
jgi:hypothetical protein